MNGAEIEFAQDVKQITTGQLCSILLTQNGEIYTCGWSSGGGLGLNMQSASRFTQIETLKTKIIEIATGRDFTLCIDENHDLWSWGRNNHGQLGHGDKNDIHSPKKVKTINIKIKQIDCGPYHSVILSKQSHQVWCISLGCCVNTNK